MSNFKLKHQNKSGLLRHVDGHKEIEQFDFPEPRKFEPKPYIPSEVERPIEYIPSYQTVYQPPEIQDFSRRERPKKYVEPIKIEPPKPVEYIPSVRNELMPELPKVDNFRPILENPNRFQDLENRRLLEESNRMRNAEKNRIKYENNQRLKKEAIEQMREQKPLFIPEYKVQEYDVTTGRPYDDSEAGRAARLAREQEAGMRDEMGYQTSNYEGGVALMKRNSATPYKLPHQSNSAFRYGHHGNPPFAPEEEVPSFHETFTNSSGVDKDSTAMAEAWKLFNKGYLDRTTHPATGKPIDMDYNINELNREGGEFYLKKRDDGSYVPRLIPTDDAEMKDEKFLSTLQPGQLFTPYQPQDE